MHKGLGGFVEKETVGEVKVQIVDQILIPSTEKKVDNTELTKQLVNLENLNKLLED